MVINGFTMRKKIHYTMAILNFVLSLVMIFFFNRNTSDLMLEIFKENEMALKVALVIFSVLPSLFIIMAGIIVERSSEDKTYNLKVFPIIFVILILVGWSICILSNSGFNDFRLYEIEWVLIGAGAVVMYLSNFLINVRSKSYFLKKLNLKVKSEFAFMKIMRMLHYCVGVGGYIIILSGVIGFYLNNRAFVFSCLVAGLCCIIITPSIYLAYEFKKRKKYLDSEKIKHRGEER